jgi:hypothetical protein
MIASAAIMTAMMMMIPMLMAAIIRPPLATISLRLACAKPSPILTSSQREEPLPAPVFANVA